MKTVADFGSYEMVDAVVLCVLASDPNGFFINVDGRDRTFFSPQFCCGKGKNAGAGADIQNIVCGKALMIQPAERLDTGAGGLVVRAESRCGIYLDGYQRSLGTRGFVNAVKHKVFCFKGANLMT